MTVTMRFNASNETLLKNVSYNDVNKNKYKMRRYSRNKAFEICNSNKNTFNVFLKYYNLLTSDEQKSLIQNLDWLKENGIRISRLAVKIATDMLKNTSVPMIPAIIRCRKSYSGGFGVRFIMKNINIGDPYIVSYLSAKTVSNYNKNDVHINFFKNQINIH